VTPRERITAVLRGQRADRVPFTVYMNHLPRGQVERELRNEGVALHERVNVFSTETPGVETERRTYVQDGRWFARETFHTPVGAVSQVFRLGAAYGTSLRCEFLVKTPEDYQVRTWMYEHEVYAPAYDDAQAAIDRIGDDGVVTAGIGYSPMQQLLVMELGVERFAIDWLERRDLLLGLYEVINARRREQYALCANGPVEFFRYGDNVTSEMIGLERYERYVVPCYDEMAAALHATGKRLGAHLDGKMKVLAAATARSRLDFVEAFAPFPDGDFELADARRAWPDKVIWINFPSAAHLGTEAQIAAETRRLLAAVAPGDRFALAITENIPEGCWQRSLKVIARVLREEGVIPYAV
jgi:hypothetical protein